jgi:hypothetical protein
MQVRELLSVWSALAPSYLEPAQRKEWARKQLDELVQRNLVLRESRWGDPWGDVEVVFMHDILRDLAVMEAKGPGAHGRLLYPGVSDSQEEWLSVYGSPKVGTSPLCLLCTHLDTV